MESKSKGSSSRDDASPEKIYPNLLDDTYSTQRDKTTSSANLSSDIDFDDSATSLPDLHKEKTCTPASRRPIQPRAQRYQTPAPREIEPAVGHNFMVIGVIVVLVAVVIWSLVSRTPQQVEPSSGKLNCSELMELKELYPLQDQKLFKSLKFGVESTVNELPPEACVFSIFSTNAELIESFMKKVLAATKHCLNTSEDHIALTPNQLNGELITNYKDELMRRKVMIINNVDEASPESATSLHSFCDTYNPVVSGSVIFLTMLVPAQPPGKPVEYISNHLHNRWRNLPEYIRSALITRMVDQTFFLKG